MRDWIADLFAGLAGRGSRLRPQRRRQDDTDQMVGDATADVASHVAAPDGEPSDGWAKAVGSDVPNTRIPPHPDDLPVAVLEFEGPPGLVPIRRGATVIGRHSDDDVQIKDVRISRHHARLTASSDRCEISNLTASRPQPNPMLVNGTDREQAEVVDGDVITLGGVTFTFRKSQG
jgi:hypothetical protein